MSNSRRAGILFSVKSGLFGQLASEQATIERGLF
jgi:hypothetical protein